MKRSKGLTVGWVKGLTALCILAVAVGFTTSLFAQEPFYKGKTIRIIVGFSPGGGFDTYARTIGRHLPKYVPGSPTVLVENMTGAGSLVAAKLGLDPVSGEELEGMVSRLFKLSPGLVAKLKEILYK